MSHRSSAVERSAAWAAWGDALGFMTELARGTSDVRRRTGVERVVALTDWRRRVGGRGGVEVTLTSGTISDDTQLRLAVGRCIRASGRFDADAFTKVELPTFLAYELGAGRGTKAAARAYTKRGTRFYNSFWTDGGSRYVDGGGNGAAMRIQPHVWAAPGHHPDAFVAGVVLDALTTHGHPRGFLGAVFHALCLADVLRDRGIPDATRARDLARYLRRVPGIIESHDLLREHWLPRWGQQAGLPLADAVAETVAELDDALHFASQSYSLDQHSDYRDLLRTLGGFDPKTRGTGTTTAVLALALAQRFADRPRDGLVAAANEIGSDTDTIATMAGALLGPLVDELPPDEVMDLPYVLGEARRMLRIGDRAEVEDFPHPDPLGWSPPRRQVDVLVQSAGHPLVLGLGRVEELSTMAGADGQRADPGWQWVRTEFGQTLLIKRRRELELHEDSPRLIEPSAPARDEGSPSHARGLDEALTEVRASGYDSALIGALVKELGPLAPYFVAQVVAELEQRGSRVPVAGALRLRGKR